MSKQTKFFKEAIDKGCFKFDSQENLVGSNCPNIVERKEEYLKKVEQLFFSIFQKEEKIKQAIRDNRIIRINKIPWNPIEEEIWLDGLKVAEFKIVNYCQD